MPRSAREVPKEVAAFGERQFKETGAAAVDVLRVKAAVMRKHFRQLKGITYLVAVVARDRVRIYFFNAAGVMLSGENVDTSMYQKVRSSSKLIAKFEKPRELTPEEQRIEATQELRDSLTKEIRRVSRFLTVSPPVFPDIFILRSSSEEISQNFGLQISDDGEHLFEETALKQKWADGLVTRTAFLAHLDTATSKTEIASLIGNGVALALLKTPGKKAWVDIWLKKSKESEWSKLVNHMVKHVTSYSPTGFARILTLLQQIPAGFNDFDWLTPISVIHDSTRVSIGTEEYHIIHGFCQSLTKPRKLNAKKYRLESIHLAPRVICDPTPLDIEISFSSRAPASDDWATISYIDGSKAKTLCLGPDNSSSISSVKYWLNIEDVYPTSGGLFSHGKDVLLRALRSMGIAQRTTSTYEADLEFSGSTLKANEKAVLERLMLGQLDILSNTLIGSPQIIDSLLEKGTIVFLPTFNHIGVDMDFLLKGEVENLRQLSDYTLESTVFSCINSTYMICSASSTWRRFLLEAASEKGCSIWPIIDAKSKRRIIRSETVYDNCLLET